MADFLLAKLSASSGLSKQMVCSVFKLVQDLLEPSQTKGKSCFQVLMSRLPPEHKARWFAGAALNTSGRLSGINSICGAVSPPKSAIRKIRALLWARPQC